ncbi:MAG: hypothetical protein RBU36_03090 [Thermoanaerobaculia bacterium]|nr:hypothetical protein [Thermoanaerobaculia bacterium]
MTRLFRMAALAAGVAATALPLFAQTPTPTPTPTPTATPTPTPIPSTTIEASVASLGIPNGGRYDASNMILEADGTIWTASANENVLARISADEKKVRKWTMPRDAAPSHLLKEPDGKLWVAQLGGFQVSLFDPQTAELTEWADGARRPTAFVRKGDGTLWLPETNGTLANFDPATGTFVYWRSTDAANPISSLTYPFLDADGSLWSADFLRGALLRFAPDGSKVTRWALPDATAQPSKIIRGPDGHLWFSFYGTAQLARFDPATRELKRYAIGVFSQPFDMKVYKDRIVYTEQLIGEVGVFDPFGSTPAATDTLEEKEIVLTQTTATVAPTKTVLETVELDVAPADAAAVTGSGLPGLARYTAVSGVPYALVLDETRKRFLVGATAEIAEVLPPIPASLDDHFFPAASSIGGRGGVRWATQVVTWNRGSADTAGVRVDATVNERLLPTDWIIGLSPTANLTIGPGKIVSQADPIGEEMKGPDTSGALRLTSGATTTRFGDVHSWIRVYRARDDGGTYGFARNYVKGAEALATGETGFLFTPPDGGASRVNAGLLVVEAAEGTVSVVSAAGTPLSAPFAFRWPAGYHLQASTIFSAFGIPPSPSARIVYTVAKGRVLPFGTSIDAVSSDPIDLPFFGPRATATNQWVFGVERGGGPLGPTSRTDLQLFNGAAGDASVSLVLRAARLAASPGAAPPARAVSLTVPAGKVVALDDVVRETFGVDVFAGSLDVVSDPPVHAFARVTAADASGGRHGYGMPALRADSTAAAGSRAVFIQAADAGWDVMESELQLTNPTDTAGEVTLRAFDTEGVAAGEPVTLPLGPKESVRVPAAFYSLAGFGTPIGRIDVSPVAGSQPVFALLVRRDQKTGDADAVVPYVVPAS